MGPSCRRRTRSTRNSSTRRTLFKKVQHKSSKNQETPPASAIISPVKPNLSTVISPDDPEISAELSGDSVYSTPKAERFRIPKIRTCPPAPKKRRTASTSSCSLQTSPISFYTAPEIELFFSLALHGVSV